MYKWLLGLEKFGSKLGLKRIKKLLKLLGNPEKGLRVVHIAGTNGKGSVAAMLSSILTEAGYKTGLFTSPHLHDIRERIRINEKNISKKKFNRLLREVKKQHNKMKTAPPTFFETLTASAFRFFKDEKVDFAIIEVGLGGMLDATNVTKPLIGIVTTVDLDHTHILGKTIKKIAKDKSQILKGLISITGETKKQALQEIRKTCKRNNSKLTVVRRKSDKSPLLGDHQKKNTAVVLETINQLKKLGFKITKKNTDNGLKKTKWPGRSEIIRKKPLTILDGAHNPAGVRSLKNLLKTLRYKNLDLVIGIKHKKDYKSMVKEIAPLASKIIITQSHINPLKAGIIYKEAKKYCKEVRIIKNIKKAVKEVNKESDKDDLICICGSLFVVAEARDAYGKNR